MVQSVHRDHQVQKLKCFLSLQQLINVWSAGWVKQEWADPWLAEQKVYLLSGYTQMLPEILIDPEILQFSYQSALFAFPFNTFCFVKAKLYLQQLSFPSLALNRGSPM